MLTTSASENKSTPGQLTPERAIALPDEKLREGLAETEHFEDVSDSTNPEVDENIATAEDELRRRGTSDS